MKCGRASNPPMEGMEAAECRENMTIALGAERGGLLAYAYSVAGMMITPEAAEAAERGATRPCKCDLRTWNLACARYEAQGADACWLALGVTSDLMKQVRAARLRALEAERGLSDAEKAELSEAEAWEKMS